MWGVGLRPQHYGAWFEAIELPYLEVMTDNLIGHTGGPGLWHTDRLAARAPILLHGIGLNIGSVDACDLDYLHGLRRLIERYRPLTVSDHLAFTRVGGFSSYELLPVARTDRSLARLVERVGQVQEILNTRVSLENVSAYVAYAEDRWREGAFFSELVRQTGCGVLLDVNNLFVNSFNFDLDPYEELDLFPLSAVTQIHVAGHSDCGSYLFDTHDQPVDQRVGALLVAALRRLDGAVPVVLECDDPMMSFTELMAEWQRIQEMVAAARRRPGGDHAVF